MLDNYPAILGSFVDLALTMQYLSCRAEYKNPTTVYSVTPVPCID
jgi:hypothetical protein